MTNGIITPNSSQFAKKLCSDIKVTIANGQNESNEVDLRGTSLVGIDVPLFFTAPTISFEVSSDGVNFLTYKRLFDGQPVIAKITGGGSYAADIFDFVAYDKIKIIISDVQPTDFVLTLKTRPI